MLYESIALPTELNWPQRHDKLVPPAAWGKPIYDTVDNQPVWFMLEVD